MTKPTKIEELARAQGMTQEELARQTSLTLSTVRRLWQDKEYREDPRMSTLRQIARVLSVPVSNLGYSEDHQGFSEQQISLVGARV
ncbi:MAG: helix-turn-helix transcriptional regulator [Blastochloris sp.]|nr:helix-turn-helix transcriptional regulator [Blastochloris sp.]